MSLLALVMGDAAGAQTVPGAADASRLSLEKKLPKLPPQKDEEIPRVVMSTQNPPEGAAKIQFVLDKVKIEGNTVFSEKELESVYAPFVGKHITLDVVWVLAGQLTDFYRKSGYFLSRAYVPAQTIEDGTITLKIAEGYIENVRISGQGQSVGPVIEWTKKIKSYRPITLPQLEEAILAINSVSALSVRAVLKPPENKDGQDGGVDLELVTAKQKAQGQVTFDNYGSRYLGPHELGVSYRDSFIPGQSTGVSALLSVPYDELQSIAFRHNIPVLMNTTVDLNMSYTTAQPGYTLTPQEIKNKTLSAGVGVSYDVIRKRGETFVARVGFDVTQSSVDILGTPLSKDKIRALKASADYEFFDALGGSSLLSTTVSQGLPLFGASKAGDSLLSRAEAVPYFTKLEFSASRLQPIGRKWLATFAMSGQMSNDALYSSEEFGYGGRNFGRAYNSSEILGDTGIVGSVQLEYGKIRFYNGIDTVPYVFYDIGKIWNNDSSGQPKVQSGSSAGAGVKVDLFGKASGSLELAFPLTREAGDPIYTDNGNLPRLNFQLSHPF